MKQEHKTHEKQKTVEGTKKEYNTRQTDVFSSTTIDCIVDLINDDEYIF